MDERHKVIRIVFLDFRKAFDLIDHNKLLENMRSMGVRPTLIKMVCIHLILHSLGKKYLILKMLLGASHRAVNWGQLPCD